MEIYSNIVAAISGFLYQPFVVPLILLAGGLFFTFRSKFVQIRLFGEMLKVVTEKPKEKGSVSSFGALMVSTASRVGTGNIVGVSTALCCGGPGAIFWLWVTALIGGASAFVESTLAQIFKRRDEKTGEFYGGPAYYMETALNARWLGVIFSVIIILTYAVGYNMLAAYNLQSCFEAFSFYNAATPGILGVIMAALFLVIVLGGARRLANVTKILVPFMGVFYVLVALVVLVLNVGNIGPMFAEIFRSAFDFQAISGGFLGSVVMWGIKRGLYSNEAGMGSAPNAAATADVSHPAKQGLVQTLSVFIDSLLICTATALMCLSSGLDPVEELSGVAYVQQSLSVSLGSFGPVFIAAALSIFAFTTIIGNYYYCEGCLRFILKRPANKVELTVFRVCAAVLVLVGAMLSAGLVWDTADMLQGLMVVINIPVILLLTKPAMKCLDDYVAQKKAGIASPTYNAKECGIKQEIAWWKE